MSDKKYRGRKTSTPLPSENWEELSLRQKRQKLLERMANSEADQRKFWRKVKIAGPDECWLWQGARYKDGYGCKCMMVNYIMYGFRVNRISYFLKHGELSDDLFVCHKCDVPTCVNPNHFFLGKQLQNMQDKVRKSRQAFGEKHGRCKLTSDQVQEIRILHFNHNTPVTEMAKRFNVGTSTIWSMLSGINWKYLPWPKEIDPMHIPETL